MRLSLIVPLLALAAIAVYAQQLQRETLRQGSRDRYDRLVQEREAGRRG